MTGRPTIFGNYDRAQDPAASITGGPFAANFPGSNLLDIRPQNVALAASPSLAFTVSLGATYQIGIITLQNLVSDPAAMITVSAGAWSSGLVTAWPADVGGGVYDALLYAALGRPRFFVPPAPVAASAINVSITGGGANLAIGSIGALELFAPPADIGDIVVGAADTVMDMSDVETAPWGSAYVTRRPVRRRKDCGFGYLPDANGNAAGVDYAAQAFRMALIAGKSRPVAIVPFPDDTPNLERRALWGLISADQQFTNQFFGFYQTTFQVTQLV
jgi:hypothetical protein